jgi:hypothetical protein
MDGIHHLTFTLQRHLQCAHCKMPLRFSELPSSSLTNKKFNVRPVNEHLRWCSELRKKQESLLIPGQRLFRTGRVKNLNLPKAKELVSFIEHERLTCYQLSVAETPQRCDPQFPVLDGVKCSACMYCCPDDADTKREHKKNHVGTSLVWTHVDIQRFVNSGKGAQVYYVWVSPPSALTESLATTTTLVPSAPLSDPASFVSSSPQMQQFLEKCYRECERIKTTAEERSAHVFNAHPVYASLSLYARYAGDYESVLKERGRLFSFVEQLEPPLNLFGYQWIAIREYMQEFRTCSTNELTFGTKLTISKNNVASQHKFLTNISDGSFERYVQVLQAYVTFVAKVVDLYEPVCNDQIANNAFSDPWRRFQERRHVCTAAVAGGNPRKEWALLLLALFALPPEGCQTVPPMPVTVNRVQRLSVECYPPFGLFVQHYCIRDKAGHLKSPEVLQTLNAALTFMYRITLGWCLHHAVCDASSAWVVAMNDFQRPTSMFRWMNGCTELIKKSKAPPYRPKEIQVPDRKRPYEVLLDNYSLFSFQSLNHAISSGVDFINVQLYEMMPSYAELLKSVNVVDAMGNQESGTADSYATYRLHPSVKEEQRMVKHALIELYTRWFGEADAFKHKVERLNRIWLALIVMTSGGSNRLNEMHTVFFRRPALTSRNVDRNVYWHKQRFLLVSMDHKTDAMLQRKFNTYKYLLHSLNAPFAVYTLIVRRFYDFLLFDTNNADAHRNMSREQREKIELDRCRLFLNTENNLSEQFRSGTAILLGEEQTLLVYIHIYIYIYIYIYMYTI